MRESSVTIAVVAPQEPFDFFDMVWEGVWSAAYELAPLNVRLMTCSTSKLNYEEQAVVLRDLLAETIHSIVLVPAHSERLDSLIDQHAVQGTPVVTLFTDAPDSRRVAFIGPDARQSGRLAGELLAKMVRPKGHILALAGSREFRHIEERYAGFREALAASKLPFGLTEIEDAELFSVAMPKKRGLFDGLYLGSIETQNTAEILQRLWPNAPCVAFHLTEMVQPMLASGAVSAVIDVNRYHQGYIAVQKAYECLVTQSVDAEWIQIPSSVVFASHLETSRVGHASSLNSIFETLVRQRTLQLRNYKEALEAANARWMRLAELDPLTDVLNRRKFEEILGFEASRATEAAPLSLLMIDVDHFKSLNDLLGHPAGDQALKTIAKSIKDSCRETDVVARIGGDEFATILRGADAADARAMQERVLNCIKEARLAGHPEVRLSITVGMATMPGDARTADELVDSADRSLYDLKRRARAPRPRLLKVVN